MAVLIVTESCFGNTLTIARSVAVGLASAVGADSVTVVGPDQTAAGIPVDLELLVVGAPTHAFSMPRQQSRRQAVEKGATAGEEPGGGIREWIERAAPRADLRVVSFDTSMKMRFQPGTASKAVFRALRKRGFQHAERGPSFYVTGTEGPLVDGEAQRAEEWGAQLGRSLRQATV